MVYRYTTVLYIVHMYVQEYIGNSIDTSVGSVSHGVAHGVYTYICWYAIDVLALYCVDVYLVPVLSTIHAVLADTGHTVSHIPQ